VHFNISIQQSPEEFATAVNCTGRLLRIYTMAEQAAASDSSSSSTMTTTIKFVPFASAVESAFWVRYCRAKLETIRLDEAPVPLRLYYAANEGLRLHCFGDSLLISGDDSSATVVVSSRNELVEMTGSLMGYNTLDDFQKVDKNQLLSDYFTKSFFHKDDAVVIQSLSSALLAMFADLKSHKVVYWFAMPALSPPKSLICNATSDVVACTPEQVASIGMLVDAMRRKLLLEKGVSASLPPYFLISMAKHICLPLSKENYTKLSSDGATDIMFGFVDPSNSPDVTTFGWPMRNLVAYLAFHLDLGGHVASLLSYQPAIVRRILSSDTTDDTADAVVVVADDANATNLDPGTAWQVTAQVPTKEQYTMPSNLTETAPSYKVVGWELNARAKPGPRSVNLRPLLDPTHLAIQAADLNLKLMKWRMIPDLNVDRLQSVKVLLIGAGTLGCNVARVLLGWGVRDFTFVDYGRVSYSNPVRQSLFTLDDCHAEGGSGRPKAQAAADALHSIAADVKSRGIMLSIPMPGHPEDDESIAKSVETLDSLIQETDVVYLLTDTRESRWLPTVVAAAHNKLLINAALGLDTWLCMRHGAGRKDRLGCYFCSDVVAPENSTRNRTLDQQCTVTRPGLALIAGSMAVEMMVAVLHHPDGAAAPAPMTQSSSFSPSVRDGDQQGPLGIIPLQVRGSLVSYSMMTPKVPAFPYCTGCAEGVVKAYLEDKVAVVQKCCQANGSSYLEDIAGLTAYRAQESEKLAEVQGWDDDDELEG
jgi:ubiquitin-like modifier-activating enzyme ATG7